MLSKPCVICGKMFSYQRSTAQCCSSNCRHKLQAVRKRLDAQSKLFSFDLWQQRAYNVIWECSPDAAARIDKIRAAAGAAIAEDAMNAIGSIMVALDYEPVSKSLTKAR